MSKTTPPAETVLVLVWHDDTEDRLGILPDAHADFVEDVLLEAGIPVYRESGDDYLWTQNSMSTSVQIALRLARQEVVYLDKTVYPYSVAIKSKSSGTICQHITVHAHTENEARKMALLAYYSRQTKNTRSTQERSTFTLTDYAAGNVVKDTDSTGCISTAR